MNSIKVDITQLPAGLVATLVGDGGITNVGPLELAFTRILAMKPALVVLDMAQFNFISSLGMGSFVALRRGVVMNGGTVKMAAVHPLVLDALKRARLDLLFEFYPTVEAAMGTAAPVQ